MIEPHSEERKSHSGGCAFVLMAAVAFAIAYLIFSGHAGNLVGAHPSPSPSRERRIPVKVATATSQNVPIEIQVVGNVMPYSTVGVTAQVTGQLMGVFFKQGDFVTKGQKLFALDARPVQANIEQIQANLQRDRAQIAQAQAVVAKDDALLAQARQNLARDVAQQKYAMAEQKRYDVLLRQGYVTVEQAEQQRATAQSATGTIRADQAAISAAMATRVSDEATLRTAGANLAADEANLQGQQVQLSYTDIRSPLTGRTGAFNLYQGSLITANSSTPMVTIDQIQPIYVSFAVPEQYLAQIRARQGKGQMKVVAHPSDQSEMVETGTITFIDNTVDTTTGTINLRGTFPNAQRRLWPGRFVNVVLMMGSERNATVIPVQAVNPGQNGSYVFVVKLDQTVESHDVKVERTLGNNAIISSGVRAGETVVTDGQLQLRPGDKVSIAGNREGGAERGVEIQGGNPAGGRHHGRGTNREGGPSFGSGHVPSSAAAVDGQSPASPTLPAQGVSSPGPGQLGAPPAPGLGGAPPSPTSNHLPPSEASSSPQQTQSGTSAPTSRPPRAGPPTPATPSSSP